MAIILIKYKPTYKITISGEELGCIENKQAFEEKLKNIIIGDKVENIDSITIKTNPEYELTLIDRSLKTDEDKIVEAIQNDLQVVYKYYEINFNQEVVDLVNTLEEAEQIVNKIKEENIGKDLKLTIVAKYTSNINEINTSNIEVAQNNVEIKVNEELKEQERINQLPEINGIKLAYTPVKGVISSRYASSESVRNYRTHGGLDIAAPTGTEIRAVSSGIVKCASYQGGYGNLVKIDHGNQVETYYGHTSKIYVTVGQKVDAGQVIALVGSTGNSTGPHLHLEIRLNGKTLNPQNYLYKQ